MELADFVFLSGNFAFEKGSVTTVNVATNFPGDFVNIIGELGDAVPAPIKNLGLGLDDLSVIEGVDVTTLYLGASGVNGFVGLNGPYALTDENGYPIVNTEAVGLSVENLDFGFVMMEPTLGALPGMSAMASWMMRGKIKGLGVPPVHDFIKQIHDAGGHLWACRMSVDMMKLTKDDFVDEVEDIINVSEFLDLSRGAQIIFV